MSFKLSIPHSHLIRTGYFTGAIEVPTDGFTATWKTDNVGTSSDNQVTLPLVAAGTYDFTVYWGDNTSSEIDAWDHAEKTHTYSEAGTYEIVTKGTLIGWAFAVGGDRLKILDISQWADWRSGGAYGCFAGCSNLILSAVDAPNLAGVTELNAFFAGCTLLNSPLGHWDVSGVEEMAEMLQDCPSFDQSFAGWNVSSATELSDLLDGGEISQANYDATLIAWVELELQTFVAVSFGTSEFTGGGSDAHVAKLDIIENFIWAITDGGEA